MNKPVYLGLSILDLSKTALYEFWCDYVKPKYYEKTKSCYIDIDHFIIYINADDTYKDIAKNVGKSFNTSSYKLIRPLPTKKSKKVIGVMKDELGGKITKKVIGLQTKTYTYLIDGGSENKKAKSTKKLVIKRKFKFED